MPANRARVPVALDHLVDADPAKAMEAPLGEWEEALASSRVLIKADHAHEAGVVQGRSRSCRCWNDGEGVGIHGPAGRGAGRLTLREGHGAVGPKGLEPGREVCHGRGRWRRHRWLQGRRRSWPLAAANRGFGGRQRRRALLRGDLESCNFRWRTAGRRAGRLLLRGGRGAVEPRQSGHGWWICHGRRR